MHAGCIAHVARRRERSGDVRAALQPGGERRSAGRHDAAADPR